MKLTKEQIQFISDYKAREFGDDFVYVGQNDISLAYTDVERENGELFDIEVFLHVSEREIATYINDAEISRIKYKSEKAFNCQLKYMDFDAFVGDAITYLDEKYGDLLI